MYTTIDRTHLLFLHKHPDVRMLSHLAWIENPHVVINIQSCDSPNFLRSFTDLELKQLYENTTGQRCVWTGDHAHAVLLELASRLPVCEINAIHVYAQAKAIAEGDRDEYLFAPGMLKPAPRPVLFVTRQLQAPRHENETLMASMGRNAWRQIYPKAEAEEQQATQAIAAAQATSAPAEPKARAARPATPSAPRTGGVREKIWAVADELWLAAGKPSDTGVVLKLRKQIMDVLEAQHEVKRTSSSNELGAWMKNRI